MKVAVIAENSRSGQFFIKQALINNIEINAGINQKNNLPSDKLITLIKCNALIKSDVMNLISGCDAVVSFIGHRRSSPANLQSEAITNVIESMNELGLKRLISLTGTGVRQPGDKISIIDRILNLSISIIDPKRIKDGIRHADIIQNSALDWSIVRVLKLDNFKTKKYKLTKNGPTKVLSSRNEVGLAVVELLLNNNFIKEMPIISKP